MNATLRTYISVLAGPILALAACAPFVPVGSPFSPQSASATDSTAEYAARSSVPVVQSLDAAARVGQMVPGVSLPATIADRAASGYLEEITRQIAGLDARQQRWERDHQGAPVQPSDWWWAIGLALAAGGSNVFSFRSGQSSGRKAA